MSPPVLVNTGDSKGQIGEMHSISFGFCDICRSSRFVSLRSRVEHYDHALSETILPPLNCYDQQREHYTHQL